MQEGPKLIARALKDNRVLEFLDLDGKKNIC
jgi:hypothetical protein